MLRSAKYRATRRARSRSSSSRSTTSSRRSSRSTSLTRSASSPNATPTSSFGSFSFLFVPFRSVPFRLVHSPLLSLCTARSSFTHSSPLLSPSIFSSSPSLSLSRRSINRCAAAAAAAFSESLMWPCRAAAAVISRVHYICTYTFTQRMHILFSPCLRDVRSSRSD